MEAHTHRSIGLAGATGIGVGAIVGGGILALAGVAFATTGPGAIVAFALNGVIAVITALSFAALSTRFPESGGTYTFARKVLSVEAAFGVGWIVWFASIVAAVLYAIGFAAFAAVVIEEVWGAVAGAAPPWLRGRPAICTLACLATAVFAGDLARRSGSGGAWINIGKLLVFALLIAGGLWAVAGSPAGTLGRTLLPMFPNGMSGLVQAMGFTFIALQGFDLIAAGAGEIRRPERTIPRAMLMSLGLALAIYLPLLLIITTVGVGPETSIQEASARDPETIVALAAGRFLGPFGYWLVMVAAILSMLSALHANLYAASRVAYAMARDRTLPPALERVHQRRRTPFVAVGATALLVAVVILLLPDVASAGAAASLIFLVTFALAHILVVLARRRVGTAEGAFHTPWFPLFPIVGGLLCLALATLQAFAVPEAGQIAAVWLGSGGVLFVTLFARRARVRDAASVGDDPHLLRLRGRSPLVLVPIANPDHAEAMVEVASALAAPGAGRVLLLNVVKLDAPDEAQRVDLELAAAQDVLRESLLASVSAGLNPEALTTLASSVWPEIRRVARARDCESLLLGLSRLEDDQIDVPVESLMRTVDRDTVVLRTVAGWRLANVRRILVAIGGRGHHDVLRARLISSLCRGAEREITYLRVVRPAETAERCRAIHRAATRLALDEARGRAEVKVVPSADAAATISEEAATHDLVVLGLQRRRRRRRRRGRIFGGVATRIARETRCAIIMISRA
ncbi:MAG: amino acid permease [Planctomycetes bacterium]|nr:amino acid permease [Planctomycetota bacterium]